MKGRNKREKRGMPKPRKQGKKPNSKSKPKRASRKEVEVSELDVYDLGEEEEVVIEQLKHLHEEPK